MRQGCAPAYCATLDPLKGRGLNPDFEPPRQLCELFGLRHEAIPALQSRTKEQLAVMEWANYCSDEGWQNYHFVEHMERSGLNFMDGIGGDMLSRNKAFSNAAASANMKSGKYREVLSWHLTNLDRITGLTLKRRSGDLFRPMIAEAEEQIFANFDAVRSAPDPHTQFLFRSRTRREIAATPTMMMGESRAALCPYLHPDMVAFCEALPLDVTADGKFHDAVIAYSFPEIAVPYEDHVQAIWTGRTIFEHLAEIRDGTVAKLRYGAFAAISEPFNQVMMMAGRRSRSAGFWRGYSQALRQLTRENVIHGDAC
jgi:hypothetical protein